MSLMNDELITYIIDQQGFDELKCAAKLLSTRKVVKGREAEKLSGVLNSLLKRMVYMKVGKPNEKDD